MCFTDCTVSSVYDHGWADRKDHDVLRFAEKSGYDVLVTGDSTLIQEQAVSKGKDRLPVSVLCLTDKHHETIEALQGTIQAACGLLEKGQFGTLETRFEEQGHLQEDRPSYKAVGDLEIGGKPSRRQEKEMKNLVKQAASEVGQFRLMEGLEAHQETTHSQTQLETSPTPESHPHLFRETCTHRQAEGNNEGYKM